jgi:hypothetical protein
MRSGRLSEFHLGVREMSQSCRGCVGSIRCGSTLPDLDTMARHSRRDGGAILHALLCATVLLGCCCVLLVAICGAPVWAREVKQGGAVHYPEPIAEPAGPPEEAESAEAPAPDEDSPETPISRRQEPSPALRPVDDREIPSGVR